MKNSLFTAMTLLCVSLGFAQCENQVTHLSGVSTVNNIAVTVTSLGAVGIPFTYACDGTFPFWIGSTPDYSPADGSYTFEFSPPIQNAMLDFVGVDNFPNAKDEIQLFVNGSHYPLTAIGNSSPCWPLAILSAEGNIIGNPSLLNGACNGTMVAGNIASLTVKDKILGISGGASFRLFICQQDLNRTEESGLHFTIYPNPLDTEAKLQFTNALIDATLYFYNTYGEIVKKISNIHGNDIAINKGDFENGIYSLQVIDKEISYTPVKLMVN